jgi:hypothetical protein
MVYCLPACIIKYKLLQKLKKFCLSHELGDSCKSECLQNVNCPFAKEYNVSFLVSGILGLN